MYSKIKNIQIIVALLKEHGVRHLVISAGTRHIPLAHSVENDPYFVCHSVVDERSAGYYALGLSKELNEPVAITCTSSTATCNYVPPITEAFYQKVPLLVLTGDRHPYLLNQLEDQMIEQVDMYKNFCRKCVSLPVVKTPDDEWYCQRLVNEALLELNHHGSGPVHINFAINQSIEDIADANTPALPEVNVIRRHDFSTMHKTWTPMVEKLKAAKRIMVVCGSGNPLLQASENLLSEFARKYNCVFVTEHISNIHCENSRNTYLLAEAMSIKVFETILPDIVISFGDNFISRIKPLLKARRGQFSHWLISDDGLVCDPFQSLTDIFECSRDDFFGYFAESAGNIKNDKKYLSMIDSKIDELRLPEIEYSNMMAESKLADLLPSDSLLHLGILNSTRLMQMCPIKDSIEVYSNVGSFGIDGSMSTFFGQAQVTDKQCYLVFGDLSFFYDMNSIGIRNIGKNVRIMMINNAGAAEFHFTMGKERLPNINAHISAEHEHRAEEWVKANGFQYISATNEAELDEGLHEFVNVEFDTPVFFEVFTDKEIDGSHLRAFRRAIQIAVPVDPAKAAAKQVIDKVPISDGLKSKIISAAKKILK